VKNTPTRDNAGTTTGTSAKTQKQPDNTSGKTVDALMQDQDSLDLTEFMAMPENVRKKGEETAVSAFQDSEEFSPEDQTMLIEETERLGSLGKNPK
jgi:hypothetical protein